MEIEELEEAIDLVVLDAKILIQSVSVLIMNTQTSKTHVSLDIEKN